MKWDRWLELGGSKRCMGTGAITSARESILNAFRENSDQKDLSVSVTTALL